MKKKINVCFEAIPMPDAFFSLTGSKSKEVSLVSQQLWTFKFYIAQLALWLNTFQTFHRVFSLKKYFCQMADWRHNLVLEDIRVVTVILLQCWALALRPTIWTMTNPSVSGTPLQTISGQRVSKSARSKHSGQNRRRAQICHTRHRRVVTTLHMWVAYSK